MIGDRVRPVQPGTQVGIVDGGVGTLGLLVTRSGFPDVFALSCSHVIAYGGRVSKGTVIEQPVDRYGESAYLAIAELSDVFTVISGDDVNSEDMALARLTQSCDPRHIVTGRPFADYSRARAEEFETGTRTVLRGVATREAPGEVLRYERRYLFKGYPFLESAKFEGVVRYSTECAAGDSGAAVVAEDTDVVLGLHIGGEPENAIGYFIPLGDYFARYGLTLCKSPRP